MKEKNKIYKWMQRIHIYGGLYATAFFIILGITALDYQHHFFGNTPRKIEKSYEVVQFNAQKNIDDVILDINDSLNFWGYVPFWEKHENNGKLHYKVFRPGSHIVINASRHSDTVSIELQKMPLIHVLRGLHVGASGNPETTLFRLWRWYAESATIIGIIVVLITLYFWIKKSIKTRTEALVAVGITLFSVGLLLLIFFGG